MAQSHPQGAKAGRSNAGFHRAEAGKLAFIYGAEVVSGTGERLGGTAALRVGQASEPVKFSEINRTDHRAQKSTA